MNANFTSIVLRLNTRMENYRTRLKGVDKYLRKNKVSRDLRKVVKRHFEQTFDGDGDQAILEQLPHSLRREVLKNIYLRSMRRVPLLFGCDSALITLIAEMLRETFELDSRLARTLGALPIPGKLTREFCAGRRATYSSPIRLYLAASLICFTLLALTSGTGERLFDLDSEPEDAIEARAELLEGLSDPGAVRMLANWSQEDRDRLIRFQ